MEMKKEEIVALLEKQVEGIEKKYRLGDEKANLTTLAIINTVAIASVIVQGRKKPPLPLRVLSFSHFVVAYSYSYLCPPPYNENTTT